MDVIKWLFGNKYIIVKQDKPKYRIQQERTKLDSYFLVEWYDSYTDRYVCFYNKKEYAPIQFKDLQSAKQYLEDYLEKEKKTVDEYYVLESKTAYTP